MGKTKLQKFCLNLVFRHTLECLHLFLHCWSSLQVFWSDPAKHRLTPPSSRSRSPARSLTSPTIKRFPKIRSILLSATFSSSGGLSGDLNEAPRPGTKPFSQPVLCLAKLFALSRFPGNCGMRWTSRATSAGIVDLSLFTRWPNR